MKYGFWEQTNDEEIMDGLLESQMVSEGVFLMDYLHGFCSMFALALHKKFGYPIFRCVSINELDECGFENYSVRELEKISYDNLPLIHDFCVVDNRYIDVRGITDDGKLFFSSFEDFFINEDDLICLELKDGQFYASDNEQYWKNAFGDKYNEMMNGINNWIDTHEHFYHI